MNFDQIIKNATEMSKSVAEKVNQLILIQDGADAVVVNKSQIASIVPCEASSGCEILLSNQRDDRSTLYIETLDVEEVFKILNESSTK